MRSSSRCKKSQSAMEYLMTYGWAILIISVVLASLFQLGVFNSSSFSPRAPPGACQVFRPSGPGTTTNINLMGVCTGLLPQYVGQFNGPTSYINVGNVAAFSPSTITLSLWIKLSALGLTQMVAGKYSDDNNRYELYINTQNYFKFLAANGATYGLADSQYAAAVGVWYHMVGVYDGAKVRIYVNGVEKNNAALTGSMSSGSVSLTIGKTQPQYTYGLISNVQIYNTSLSANEIQALYVEGVGGAPLLLQNLAGWWPLNGDTRDYSGNNNNGVPTAISFTSQYGK